MHKTILVGGMGYDPAYCLQGVSKRIREANERVVLNVNTRHIQNPEDRTSRVRCFVTEISDKIDIVGHGLGAMAALSVACEYPDRIGKVILISPTPSRVDPQDESGVYAMYPTWTKRLVHGSTMPTKEEYKALAGPFHRDHEALALQARCQFHISELAEVVTRSVEGIGQLSFPVLLIQGSLDAWTNQSGMNKLIELCSNSRNVPFEHYVAERAGHFPQLSVDRDVVLSRISKFLN